METVDKILCCDKGNNSDPMAMASYDEWRFKQSVE